MNYELLLLPSLSTQVALLTYHCTLFGCHMLWNFTGLTTRNWVSDGSCKSLWYLDFTAVSAKERKKEQAKDWDIPTYCFIFCPSSLTILFFFKSWLQIENNVLHQQDHSHCKTAVLPKFSFSYIVSTVLHLCTSIKQETELHLKHRQEGEIQQKYQEKEKGLM